MSQAALGRLFDERRATTSKRIKVQVTDFMAQHGAKGCFVPGQKKAAAVSRYRAAQRGNHNRTGGKKIK
jgi:hypothetical protein